MNKQMIAALAMGLLAAGCASTGGNKEEAKQPEIAGVPTWVTSPSYKDGLAATECVPASSSFSLDRKEAVANARQNLAQQLDLKVKAMDKTYQRRTRAEGEASTGSTFESVSRQVTQTQLNGSRVVKTGYVDLGGTKNLCVMVAFGDSQMKEIFDGLIEASDRKVSPQDEDILYQEFKAHKAQQEMDKELGN
ncbi:MAG TPA: LPP20 family lipoprotein [Gammaproteobacteria bacterium]|nr:LPP20 family lipoprotein [Gammaproteobacteria bacterium]